MVRCDRCSCTSDVDWMMFRVRLNSLRRGILCPRCLGRMQQRNAARRFLVGMAFPLLVGLSVEAYPAVAAITALLAYCITDWIAMLGVVGGARARGRRVARLRLGLGPQLFAFGERTRVSVRMFPFFGTWHVVGPIPARASRFPSDVTGAFLAAMGFAVGLVAVADRSESSLLLVAGLSASLCALLQVSAVTRRIAWSSQLAFSAGTSAQEALARSRATAPAIESGVLEG